MAWLPFSLIAAVLLCVTVGLAFGVFQARLAGALDPIAALRSYGLWKRKPRNFDAAAFAARVARLLARCSVDELDA